MKDCLLQAAMETTGTTNVLERFLDYALQACLFDIPHLAAQMDSEVNLSGARRRLNDARRELAPETKRIAAKFAENPDLYRRYRHEWQCFLERARCEGCAWAHRIDLPGRAA